ncbi:MAG: phosphatase PAP2 family protein [Terracidiphilus sp.]
MIPPHFHLAWVEFLSAHRNIYLTHFFHTASFFGSANFYVLFTILLYVVWDKRLAVRLIVVVLLTVAFNDLLKVLIKNPRPFMADGTYKQKWAVSPAEAKSLALEYSTPSGHAMGSAAFYSYLLTFTRNRFVRLGLVLLIVLIGVSRPYLGVHYVEDVLLGWAIGLLFGVAASRYTGTLANLWSKVPHGLQIAITIAGSAMVWLLLFALSGWQIDYQVQEMTGYCGWLTGIVIACPLELRVVNFDPRGGGPAAKLLRFILSIAIMLAVAHILDAAFAPIAKSASIVGSALDYLRYVATSVAAMFFAPFIFCKVKLATARPVS